MSDTQIADLRAANDAMRTGDWAGAEAAYVRVHEAGVAPQHKALNLAMTAIGSRRYAYAQELLAEYDALTTTPNMTVQHEALSYLAAVGCGDEANINRVIRAMGAAHGYTWAKSPIRYLVRGLQATEDGEVREAADALESVMRAE